jgi:hypothetical protein
MKLFDVCRFDAFIPRAGLGRLAVISMLASIAGNMAIQPASAEALPVVTFKAEPTTVSKGGYATLTWSSTNADKCHAYGPWSGS